MGRRKTLAAIITIAMITALGAALNGRTTQAQAQLWPQRPVRIIVPYAAGGNSDGMARMVAQRLGDAFGQTFIVENRLGPMVPLLPRRWPVRRRMDTRCYGL